MKVLCIGESCIEITCPIDSFIGENSKVRIIDRIESGGGVAGNIAYLLGKWGVEVFIASMVGSDDAASKIKKDYENIGVKTDFMETSYDKPTSTSIVLQNKASKSKTILDLTNNTALKKYAFNIEPDIIITDANDYSASLAAFDKYPKSISVLALDSLTNEALEMGKYVNYIIVNQDVAEKISNSKVDFNNSSSIVNIYNYLKQRYLKSEIVITLGERGCVYSINNQVKIMPPVKVDVVDTNGAGAIFVGALMYGIGRNFGFEKSLCYASIAASLSTTKLSSRLSIPSLTEVSNYYDTKFGAAYNPNNSNNQNSQNSQNAQSNENEPPTINNATNQNGEVTPSEQTEGISSNDNQKNA